MLGFQLSENTDNVVEEDNKDLLLTEPQTRKPLTEVCEEIQNTANMVEVDSTALLLTESQTQKPLAEIGEEIQNEPCLKDFPENKKVIPKVKMTLRRSSTTGTHHRRPSMSSTQIFSSSLKQAPLPNATNDLKEWKKHFQKFETIEDAPPRELADSEDPIAKAKIKMKLVNMRSNFCPDPTPNKPTIPRPVQLPDSSKDLREWQTFLVKTQVSTKSCEKEGVVPSFSELTIGDFTALKNENTGGIYNKQNDISSRHHRRGTSMPARSSQLCFRNCKAFEGACDVLMKYIWENKPEELEAALSTGEDPDARNEAWCCPLHCACECGMLRCVEILLDYGAEIDIEGGASYRTGLHWAATNGHTNIVKLLLKRGADPCHQDWAKNMPGSVFNPDVPPATQKAIQDMLRTAREQHQRESSLSLELMYNTVKSYEQFAQANDINVLV